jgi:anthranilate phosphoribosyltransferase
MSELSALFDAGTSEVLFGRMLDGQMSDMAIAELLIQIGERGETPQEIVGAVRAMRERMIRVAAPENAVDVCGTGGDGSHSLNISTAVAIVVAACEVPVVKHGNRAASSKAGGADTLEALGLNLDRATETAEATLADLGIAFLFAQHHHPALARIAPIRKSLGRRTIFNLLGPLCNPASVTRQLVGVASPALIPLYAEAMAELGMERAMIVSGAEGLDELSISGESHLKTLGFAQLSNVVTPEDAGLSRHSAEALKGGDAAYNAAALRRLLAGETETAQDRAYRDAVLLNAAGALIVAGEVSEWTAGVEEAAEAIDKGLAKTLLDCWMGF